VVAPSCLVVRETSPFLKCATLYAEFSLVRVPAATIAVGFSTPSSVSSLLFPVTVTLTAEIEALGKLIVEHLGPGAAARFRSGDLTRRQAEILQLVAQGQTNAEIARTLVFGPRTVEIHVTNIRTALDSRSRAETVRHAAELGLLEAKDAVVNDSS
jgi:DNA-binding CsgD family transcriptional regulator